MTDPSSPYDLVLRDALIDRRHRRAGPRQGDLAVRGDRIVGAWERAFRRSRRSREIDLGGLVVSPGFIDVHIPMTTRR